MSTHTTTTSTITRLIIHGATGRMGSRLCALAHTDERFSLVAAIAQRTSTRLGTPAAIDARGRESVVITHDHASITHGCADVVVDFSSDTGTLHALELARRAHAALLVGTTALTTATLERLRDAATTHPILVAPNTSLGVAVLAALVKNAAAALVGYELSLVEAHHSQKKDAPSGTALRLAQAARDAGATLRDDQILALRGGDVIGEHTLRFAGPGEYIELTHRATSRDVFVRGALRAAAWLKTAPPGWWTINDSLALPAR